jgi:hypothetical protein
MRDWSYRRNPRAGVESWKHPEPPEGLSMLEVSRTPGQYRLRAEGNLITALHGPAAAAGTLGEDEVLPSVDAFLGLVADGLGTDVPDPHRWDLHRLDPSRTVQLPPDLSTAEVVSGALVAWSVLTSRNVTLHKRETCTRAITKWRSHSVYSKTADLRHKGYKNVPEGLLRLEARLRPRSAKSAAFIAFRPTLALTPADLEVIVTELDLLMGSLTSVMAGQDLALVRTLVESGCAPSTAIRVSATYRLLTAFGPGVWSSLGVPERTGQRWAAEVREWQGKLDTSALAANAEIAAALWQTVSASSMAGAAETGGDEPGAARKRSGAAHGSPRPTRATAPAIGDPS